MNCFLCCCRRSSYENGHYGRGSRTGSRYDPLTVSFNSNITRTSSTQGGVAYEPPFLPPSGRLPALKDFGLHTSIGRGSFGKVFVAEHSSTGRLFALKAVPKSKLITDKQFEQIQQEIEILKQVRHPNCVTLHCSFQDDYHLFYCFTYIPGGSLYFHLHHRERFTEPVARFYFAQIAIAFQYLHSMNIIYRDLKPDNCMLSREGHLVLVDFGSAKQLDSKARTSTFVGTPHYMAPEVLRGQPYSFSADWWSLGILLYELLTGEAPFVSADRIQLYRSVLRGEVVYPDYLSPRARDLLSKLIERDIDARLGSYSISEEDTLCIESIRKHSFFSPRSISNEERDKYMTILRGGGSRSSVVVQKFTGAVKKMTRKGSSTQLLYDGEANTWTWSEMERLQVKPPLRPRMTNVLDTQFFDTAITSLPAVVDPSERCQQERTFPNFDHLISVITPIESGT